MPNKIYVQEEASTTWEDGGTPAITLATLAADAVRVGAQKDLGVAPRSEWYSWALHISGFTTAPVVGETVDLYLSTSYNATAGKEDGLVGIADATGATADLANLLLLGSVVVQTTTAGDDLNASGIVRIAKRYVMPVVHNNTADILETTAPDHQIVLTPIPPEIQ